MTVIFHGHGKTTRTYGDPRKPLEPILHQLSSFQLQLLHSRLSAAELFLHLLLRPPSKQSAEICVITNTRLENGLNMSEDSFEHVWVGRVDWFELPLLTKKTLLPWSKIESPCDIISDTSYWKHMNTVGQRANIVKFKHSTHSVYFEHCSTMLSCVCRTNVCCPIFIFPRWLQWHHNSTSHYMAPFRREIQSWFCSKDTFVFLRRQPGTVANSTAAKKKNLVLNQSTSWSQGHWRSSKTKWRSLHAALLSFGWESRFVAPLLPISQGDTHRSKSDDDCELHSRILWWNWGTFGKAIKDHMIHIAVQNPPTFLWFYDNRPWKSVKSMIRLNWGSANVSLHHWPRSQKVH